MKHQIEDPLQGLAAMVVKDGVGIGVLAPARQRLALAWVWAGLPAQAVLSEREVNALLQAQLAGAAVWLDTDHVELRRWLVDAGWLQRDGYGREYRRVPADALAPALQPLAAALAGVDTAAWTAAQRTARDEARAARRRDWAQAAAAAEAAIARP